jgi:hypothetical protein
VLGVRRRGDLEGGRERHLGEPGLRHVPDRPGRQHRQRYPAGHHRLPVTREQSPGLGDGRPGVSVVDAEDKNVEDAGYPVYLDDAESINFERVTSD